MDIFLDSEQPSGIENKRPWHE